MACEYHVPLDMLQAPVVYYSPTVQSQSNHEKTPDKSSLRDIL